MRELFLPLVTGTQPDELSLWAAKRQRPHCFLIVGTTLDDIVSTRKIGYWAIPHEIDKVRSTNWHCRNQMRRNFAGRFLIMSLGPRWVLSVSYPTRIRA